MRGAAYIPVPQAAAVKAYRGFHLLSAGEQLEAEAAQATPPHQYVPWILVNGVPLGKHCPLQPPTKPFAGAKLAVDMSNVKNAIDTLMSSPFARCAACGPPTVGVSARWSALPRLEQSSQRSHMRGCLGVSSRDKLFRRACRGGLREPGDVHLHSLPRGKAWGLQRATGPSQMPWGASAGLSKAPAHARCKPVGCECSAALQ